MAGLACSLSCKETILIGLMFALLAYIRSCHDRKTYVQVLSLPAESRVRFLRVREAILWPTRHHLPGRLIFYPVRTASRGMRHLGGRLVWGEVCISRRKQGDSTIGTTGDTVLDGLLTIWTRQ